MIETTTEIIEQTNIKLIQSGGSKMLRIPANWLDKIETNDDTEFTVRLMKGKFGLFIDAYKNK